MISEPYFELYRNGIRVRIGNTPVLRIEINGVEFYAKAEWFNSFELYNGLMHGSVKMRAAYFMVSSYMNRYGADALMRKIVVEPTSGNTGIALAALAKLYGFRFQPFVSYKATEEVKGILKDIGFPAFEVDDSIYPSIGNTATDQAIAFVRSQFLGSAAGEKYLWLNQFENDSNPKAHEETTAKEIIRFAKNTEIDAVVTGIGTGGSYVGLRKGLQGSGIAVIGVQPQRNHRIQGLRNLSESAFMPKILEGELSSLSYLPVVKEDDAFWIIEKMLSKYNVLVGLSSGVTAWHAYRMAKAGKKVVAIFADTGFNYKKMYESMGLISAGYDFKKLYDLNNLPVA